MTHDNPVPPMSELGREPIARIPCYEGPESRGLPSTLDLSADDLTRHILVLGSTGAGKTTLLRNIMRQLIAHRAGDPDRKLALLIFDF